MKQQEINKQLNLDKGDTQAVANDNVPQDEQAAGSFVEQAYERFRGRRINVCSFLQLANLSFVFLKKVFDIRIERPALFQYSQASLK